MNFSTQEKENYTVVVFDLADQGGVIEPHQLADIIPPIVNTQKGVVISGRGPVWLYATLVHHYHPTPWVATYDPRLGAVVVQSHCKDVKIGDVIPVE